MTARYHIRKDGGVGVCTAEEGNCPLGGEHFETPTAARKAAEKELMLELAPPLKALSQAELSELASTTRTPGGFEQVLAHGGTRALSRLVDNEAATPETLRAARGKLTGAAARRLVTSGRLPLADASLEDFKTALDENPERRSPLRKAIADALASDELTDEKFAAYQDSKLAWEQGAMALAAYRNPHNRLTYETLKRVPPVDLSVAVGHPKFNAAEHFEKVDFTPYRASLLMESVHKDQREIILEKMKGHPGEQEFYGHLSADLTEEEWKRVADRAESSNGPAAVALWRSGYPAIRAKAAERMPVARSLQKLDIVFKNNELPFELKVKGSLIERVFDADRVKAMGLDAADMDTHVRYNLADWLQGGSYDSETGVYRGYSS